MTLAHDQIQERIDRTINNHQFTCQTVGYNIYLLETPMNRYTLPIKEWTSDTKMTNQSYFVTNREILQNQNFIKFVTYNKYHIHTLSFNELSIQIGTL